MADAIQAYIQALLTGVPCWVELPGEAWPPWVKLNGFRRPVCRLRKALYGHRDAETMWEQHCHKAVTELGFVPVGDEWPSLFYHKGMKLLLAVYVDDLKMAGPKQNLAKGWELLRTRLRLEPGGTEVNTVTCDMETYLDMTVKKVSGLKESNLQSVTAPSLPAETKNHPARAPVVPGAKSCKCTWCANELPLDKDGRLILPRSGHPVADHSRHPGPIVAGRSPVLISGEPPSCGEAFGTSDYIHGGSGAPHAGGAAAVRFVHETDGNAALHLVALRIHRPRLQPLALATAPSNPC